VERFADGIRRLIRGQERGLARRWQAKLDLARDAGDEADRELFRARFCCRSPNERVLLGRVRDRSGNAIWCGLPAQEFLRHHSWITGATGSGKSYFTAGCLLQVLQAKSAVTVVDLKSELTELLLGTILPALAANGREDLASRIRVVRPFGDPLPALRVTEPEAGVPRGIQAQNLASALADAIGGDLGLRMERVFLRMAALALERRLPLTVLQQWLQSPASFLRDARRSEDPALRMYASSGFERESRPAIDALASRLDSFLFLDEVRLALSAPSCVSFTDGLEDGAITIVDLGSPPAGADRVQRFWSGILLGRITRAVLSRPVRDESPPAWLVIEEVQEALSKESAEQLARLLALARHKRVAVTLINQQPAQLSAVDPMLVRILRTNAGFEFAFRCNYEDARALVEPMPIPPGTTRAGELRQALAQDLTRLPIREYLLWAKQESFGAQRVRSPRLDIEALRADAAQLDPDVRGEIRRGTMSIPRADLEALAKSEQPNESAAGSSLFGVFTNAAKPGLRHPRLG
jgi:hypothetical protein